MSLACFSDYLLHPGVRIRSPLVDPVQGDVLEGPDGERRSVEVHGRDCSEKVRYRRAGGDRSGEASAQLLECGIEDWRRWAENAEVVHAAHRSAKSPGRKKTRRLREMRPSAGEIDRRRSVLRSESAAPRLRP